MSEAMKITVGPPGGGLYNSLFGVNPLADALLKTVGLTRADCGRFRDAYALKGEVCVYTRNGGGNREEYQPVIDRLKENPLYLRDADDEYDTTYCTIYFKVPERWAEVIKQFEVDPDDTPGNRWFKMRTDEEYANKVVTESLKDSSVQRLMEQLKKLVG